MKIIFSDKDNKAFWRERQEACKGCYICPCCGEWRQSFIYDMLGKNTYLNRTGIDIHTERRQIYKPDTDEFLAASVDCFSCNNCKAKWESEPFDWGTDDYFGDMTYDNEIIDEGDDEIIFIGD